MLLTTQGYRQLVQKNNSSLINNSRPRFSDDPFSELLAQLFVFSVIVLLHVATNIYMISYLFNTEEEIVRNTEIFERERSEGGGEGIHNVNYGNRHVLMLQNGNRYQNRIAVLLDRIASDRAIGGVYQNVISDEGDGQLIRIENDENAILNGELDDLCSL